MNGTACTGYLGETYSSLWSGKQLLFAKDADGKMIENPETEILTSDVTAYALEINTLEGASVRTNVPTGIRWQTQINKADYDALKAAIGTDIKEIRFGTLISPTKHVQDAGAFTPEAIKAQNFQDSGYKDVAGTDGEWYKTTEEGYIFAGSLVEILAENYDLKFSAGNARPQCQRDFHICSCRPQQRSYPRTACNCAFVHHRLRRSLT